MAYLKLKDLDLPDWELVEMSMTDPADWMKQHLMECSQCRDPHFLESWTREKRCYRWAARWLLDGQKINKSEVGL